MGVVQIKNMLEDLKLTGMIKVFDILKTRATKESWTSEESLDFLLQAELQYREQAANDRRIKNSKLPEYFKLEDFDFISERTLTKVQVKELYSLKWLEQGRSIVITGPTGVGKSFLAKALGYQTCLRKRSLLFMSVSDFLEGQSMARNTNTYLRFRTKMTKPDVLILDDFGLRKMQSQEAHDFVDLIKERSRGKPTIITTQVPILNWTELIEDPVVADTLIDRLVHTSVKIDIKGPTYRLIEGSKLDKLIN